MGYACLGEDRWIVGILRDGGVVGLWVCGRSCMGIVCGLCRSVGYVALWAMQVCGLWAMYVSGLWAM